jgi:hypothetical protein
VPCTEEETIVVAQFKMRRSAAQSANAMEQGIFENPRRGDRGFGGCQFPAEDLACAAVDDGHNDGIAVAPAEHMGQIRGPAFVRLCGAMDLSFSTRGRPPARRWRIVQRFRENVRKAKGPEAQETIAAMAELAAAFGADGSARKAIKLGEEALALAQRVLPAGDPGTIEAMKALVPVYKSVDLNADALKLEAEIQSLLRQK